MEQACDSKSDQEDGTCPTDAEASQSRRQSHPGAATTIGVGVAGTLLAGPIGGVVSVSTNYLSGDTLTSTVVAGGVCVVLLAGGHILAGVAAVTGATVGMVPSVWGNPAAGGTRGVEAPQEAQEAEVCPKSQQADHALSASDSETKEPRHFLQTALRPTAGSLALSSGQDPTAASVPPPSDGLQCGCCCFESLSALISRRRSNANSSASSASAEQLPRESLELNQETFRRHLEQAKAPGTAPTLLLYDAASGARPSGAGRPPAVRRLPLNGEGVEVVENEYFVGRMAMMHRSADAMTSPHDWYFATRTRRWEVRLQGRFKKKPEGQLFAGVVMKDFAYSEPLGFFASWLGSLSLAPLEYVVGAKLHFTFGDRAEAALSEKAELAHIVGGLEVFDQIVVTKDADSSLRGWDPVVPPLCGELEGLGIARRDAGGAGAWAEAVKEVTSSIGPGATYTFCFWSAARFIDLMGDQLVNLVPLVPALSLSSTVLGNWPPHFVFYALEHPPDQEDAGNGHVDAVAHLERHKTYFMDLVIVNPGLPENLELAKRYTFVDQGDC